MYIFTYILFEFAQTAGISRDVSKNMKQTCESFVCSRWPTPESVNVAQSSYLRFNVIGKFQTVEHNTFFPAVMYKFLSLLYSRKSQSLLIITCVL